MAGGVVLPGRRRADRAEDAAPITAPIPSMTRSPAPSARFSGIRALAFD